MKILHVNHANFYDNFEFLYAVVNVNIQDKSYNLSGCDLADVEALKRFFVNETSFELSIAKKIDAEARNDFGVVLMPSEFHYEFTLRPLDSKINPLTIICKTMYY